MTHFQSGVDIAAHPLSTEFGQREIMDRGHQLVRYTQHNVQRHTARRT